MADSPISSGHPFRKDSRIHEICLSVSIRHPGNVPWGVCSSMRLSQSREQNSGRFFPEIGCNFPEILCNFWGSFLGEKLHGFFRSVASRLLCRLRSKTLSAKAFRAVGCAAVALRVALERAKVAELHALRGATMQLFCESAVILFSPALHPWPFSHDGKRSIYST